jgi:hypothetical protein
MKSTHRSNAFSAILAGYFLVSGPIWRNYLVLSGGGAFCVGLSASIDAAVASTLPL